MSGVDEVTAATAATSLADAADETAAEQVVTPWDVSGGADGKIDYLKLVNDFGCQVIDQSLIERIETVTGCKAHPFLRRGMFFAHRELDQIVSAYEKGEKFYLYTAAGLRRRVCTSATSSRSTSRSGCKRRSKSRW